ncbi:hypothetical protein [Noviherbaspirillum denitrificans]|uniref:hypothetical protein n=1 Tax=Noviherbaspirillum denitrificans TaxID=1968433 RepID=UPI001F162FDD|nr:hypothetical protein [Noviherbaspirillum denitrificans]
MARIADSKHAASALSARDIANAVAKHKSIFFRVKASDGALIDYSAATNGALKLIPGAKGMQALREDYDAMLDAGLLPWGAPSFDEPMRQCLQLENQAKASLA